MPDSLRAIDGLLLLEIDEHAAATTSWRLLAEILLYSCWSCLGEFVSYKYPISLSVYSYVLIILITIKSSYYSFSLTYSHSILE